MKKSRRSNTSNRRITYTYNGESKILAEWCEIYKIRADTVARRLKHGWSFDRAITTLPDSKHHRKN